MSLLLAIGMGALPAILLFLILIAVDRFIEDTR